MNVLCKTCRYLGVSNSSPVCRYSPPNTSVVPMQAPRPNIATPTNRHQGGVMPGFISWWPPVNPDQDWCSKHEPAH